MLYAVELTRTSATLTPSYRIDYMQCLVTQHLNKYVITAHKLTGAFRYDTNGIVQFYKIFDGLVVYYLIGNRNVIKPTFCNRKLWIRLAMHLELDVRQ